MVNIHHLKALVNIGESIECDSKGGCLYAMRMIQEGKWVPHDLTERQMVKSHQ